MKPALLFAALCISTCVFGQLAFQEITAPRDFAMSAIRKSPTGEYFVQATGDRDSIYTSLDGQQWIKTHLPVSVPLENMQFFSDGTPVMQTEYYEHLVRRNGIWYIMQAITFQNVENSFIKNDTLFTFQGNSFFYSTDKGETFVAAFEYDDPVNAFEKHVWKFDHHFVLQYAYDGEYFLSVFDETGTRVLHQELYLNRPNTLYNVCGEVLVFDDHNYYRINEELNLTHGGLSNILPESVWHYDLQSANGDYFVRQGSDLWRTHGCDLDWEIAASNESVLKYDYMVAGPEGEVYFYNSHGDHFIEANLTSNTWENHPVDINQPRVSDVNESESFHQGIITTNNLFTKHRDGFDWIELDSSGGISTTIQYSPDGDLYIFNQTNILHSKDNGASFFVITPPPTTNGFRLYGSLSVLDNDVLFYLDDLFGEAFYTLDNGAHWVSVALPYYGYSTEVKLVDNNILIAGGDFTFLVSHINLVTHEVTSDTDENFSNALFTDMAILDDGTVYFSTTDLFSGENLLLRYRIGVGFELASTDSEVANIYPLNSSGNNLYGFNYNEYYLLSGDSILTLSYEGLPAEGGRQFYVAESEHLFVIINSNRIFRSLAPLSNSKYLSGKLFFDQNQDCVADTLEPTLKHWVVTAKNDYYLRSKQTDTDGKFSFDLPDGTYTVSVRPPSSHWDVCTSTYEVTVDSSHADIAQNFQGYALAHCANLEIDFSTPLLRRCFENTYTIRVRNTGPLASLGTTARIELDPYFEFISASIPSTQVEDNIYAFDLGVLDLNEEVIFRIVFRVSCDAPLGIEHCLEGRLEDDNLCGESRSYYEECQENIGSYDPNDKRVFNEVGHEVERVDKGEYIYYHIRFQNTGTDTAFNVRINDPLSPMVDYATLEMLGASHPYTWLLTDGPALSILFENILLADSNINEPASHGFVKFRIKPLPEFDYGTSISNTAAIYFDFNDPVLTNTVTTMVLPPVKTVEPADLIEFGLFPNPANASIQLSLSDDDVKRIDSYEVVDVLGQQLLQLKSLHTSSLPVSHLTPGVYNLVLRAHGVIIGMKKFVKL